MKNNVSLVLLNTHFSTNGPRPFLPNVIEIGGIQVKPEASKLPKVVKNLLLVMNKIFFHFHPQQLQTFLDSATDGAIIMSFGSNAKTSFLSKETVGTFLKVFTKLKQRVVMKWESDELEGKPENVYIANWLPQDDILAHSNVKLFISHCGLGYFFLIIFKWIVLNEIFHIGSITEAKYHGVPVLGIPLLGDQPENADQVVKEGWALQVALSTLNEISLHSTIEEILHNKSYVEKVKKLSKISRDRPKSPQETAIFWVEYVLRHKGAPHLQFPVANLNFFQRNSLDVILVILMALSIVIEIFVILCRTLLKKI